LLSENDWRSAFADKVEEDRPEMTLVFEAFLFASGREALTGTGSSPDFAITPPGFSESTIPDPDAGKEVNAPKSPEVSRLNKLN